MILAKLLKELSTNILRDRSRLVAGPNDRLWQDEDLVEYIDEAQKRFARRSLCLRDDITPEFTQIQLEQGVQRYVLDEQVVSVMSARYHTDTVDLQRGNHQTLGGQPLADGWTSEGWNPSSASLPQTRPHFFWTDDGVSIESTTRVVFLIDREPSADEDGNLIKMRVCRLPCTLTINSMKKEPEIPSVHHLDMLDWAAYRALRNDDADGASEKADKFKESFTRAVEEARQESLRKMHAQVGWSFGMNGFSWER